MENKHLIDKEHIELKKVLMALKQSTDNFVTLHYNSSDCIVMLSRVLCQLKNMQIKLKNNQHHQPQEH